jgi:hypothetical protein
VVVEDDFEFGIYDVDSLETQHSATGRWLQRWCPGIGAVDVDGYFLIPEGGLVDPYQLALDALASVADRSTGDQDKPIRERSPVRPGADLALARPNLVAVLRGDRERRSSLVHREGHTGGDDLESRRRWQRHLPWTRARRGVRAPGDASDCTYTYRTSSAGQSDGTFTLQATVTLEVTWTSNVTGGGTLPAISRSSTLAVEVGEIQAIGTRGGR